MCVVCLVCFSGFASIPSAEMSFGHHQTRKTRPPDPIIPDFHIHKVGSILLELEDEPDQYWMKLNY